MVFALYQPPTDFSRGGDDDNATNRFVSFQAQVATASPIVESLPLTILRPPVMLVHGLWGGMSDWNTFTTFITDQRFNVSLANYDYAIGGSITASVPGGYAPAILASASGNALGFDFNAPLVLSEIQAAVQNFRQANNAAAAQMDVVAHSMGGTITRTLQNLPGFTSSLSFGIGIVHKLITIGTPHLGTPLATQLIQTNNTCTRNLLAANNKIAFFTATVSGVSGVSGGIGDLHGDGSTQLNSSPALNRIYNSNGPMVPTATLAGTTTPSNLTTLDDTISRAHYIRHKCASTDPLAANLTSTGWNTVFAGNANDGVVPLLSQLNGGSSGQVTGLIHSAGLTRLSFSGPSELDPNTTNAIQTLLIQLLNASVGSFVNLP